MDKLKKAQKLHRTAFTKCLNAYTENLSAAEPDKDDVVVSFQLLENKMAELDVIQTKIVDLMLEDERATDEEIQREMNVADEYRSKYLQAKRKMSNFAEPQRQRPPNPQASAVETKSHKYPKLEIPKFNGNVREWLQFWSQFKKVHDDANLTNEDKFQYLLQAVIPGTRASELVLSFPPTGENYIKAVDSLKERFGRDELLVEVYVRELLELVLQNVLKRKENMRLSSLYDKLETHMRALETLGVTASNCAAMLFPLVESSLPEELLRTWQRSTNIVESGTKDAKARLTALMKFLQSEVQNEERINMAVQGFSLPTTEDKTQVTKKKEHKKDVATAAGLLATNSSKVVECMFCKASHESADCEAARKMPLEKKREIAKQEKCCFNCLKKGHSFNRCRMNSKCAWCNRRHLIVMCPQMNKNEASVAGDKVTPEPLTNEHNLASFQDTPVVYLQTLWVKAYNDEAQVDARVIIDTGSQRSYITENLAKRLGYKPTGKQEVVHSLFGGGSTVSKVHNIFKARVKNMEGNYACNFKVMSQDIICKDVTCLQPAAWVHRLERMCVKLTDVREGQMPIDILIGADVAGKLYTGKRHALDNGLTAIETLLGWTVIGEPKESPLRNNVVLTVTSLFLQQMDISQLWNLDVLGITDPVSKRSQAQRDIEVKSRLLDSVVLNNEGRYEVELPWIEDHAPLPSNEVLSKKRLERIISKLKSENMLEAYGQIFKEWTDEGVVEKIPECELNTYGHYLPHRPVIKEESSTKIRPVFDASARDKNSPSLNQCLEKGPNLIELMSSVLLRFRKGKFGVTSDIKKAFLQISVHPRDRDKLRFFWENQGQLEVYRHRRVVFGVSCSPFILGAIIQFHLGRASRKELFREYSHGNIEKLKNSFYVDNCVTSVDTEEELAMFIDEATAVMAEGGFDLRGWESTGSNDSQASMVLGLLWNKADDTLSLNMSLLEKKLPLTVTKRVILSSAHRIFDPIGFACPVLLLPKLLLQEVWQAGNNWDTEVSEELKERFGTWLRSLPALKELKIPRRFGWVADRKALDFHTFCDASGIGYAAVVFLRAQSENGTVLRLVAAKARVAPLKRTTIPRLELLAATIAARLITSVTEALDCQDVTCTFWSDSTTVLSWIKRETQWNTFVCNRVGEIRKLTAPENWRYVPGKINPADTPSRGCTADQLISSRWWEGPDWLREERHWPSSDFDADEELINVERKKIATVAMLNYITGDSWYSYYFSNYFKLLRFIAWILRFINNCRLRKDLRRCGSLTSIEIADAETRLFLILQSEMFSSVKDERLKGFQIFTDDKGILRVKTKIINRDDTFNFRCPVILDSRHIVVKRLIEYEHSKQHAGVQSLIIVLREKYWIIAARRLIRSVVNRCVRCKRYSIKRLEAEPSALPVNRVRDAMVFEVVGVDFAGPLFLKGGEKAWICLFTCAIYRAIHLELVSSLSTPAFLEALRRFIARRGRPTVIYSDNGTNFKGFQNACQKLNWDLISEYSTSQMIEWRFNPPSAAWWGGWWERLVRTVKQSLRKVLGKASVTYEELYTILCDCEALINARPLSYVADDPSDLIPLTPALFLQEIREVGVPDCDTIDRANLCARYRYRQKLKDDLRRRFRVEYLGLLKAPSNIKTAHKAKVNDVVLVGDDTLKRLDWPIGIITAVIPGLDGKIRVVKVKTQKGELTRPIQRIYPLELSLSNADDEISNVLKNTVKNNVEIVKNRRAKTDIPSGDVIVEPSVAYVTRSGRTVKSVRRFN